MPIPSHIINQTLDTPLGTAAYKVVEMLTDAGYDAWWVGGCTREMLLERIPHDIDIGTSARPDEVQSLLHVTDDHAEAFGSLIVRCDGHAFEVTTFREDDQVSDGRHPESVSFGSREADAKRRDITINAIYYHPISREVYDPFDGIRDMKERLIHFIGDPGVRIQHDALRLLRVVRFRSTIDGQYHPDTFAGLQEHASEIEKLSGSRQLQELEKILRGPRPARALEDLWETKILQYMIPELFVCKGIPQPRDFHKEGDVWDHLLKCVEECTDEHGIDVRIAALFHDSGKAETFSITDRIHANEHASVSGDIAETVLTRLQCPTQRRKKVVWLIKHHMMMAAFFSMSDERKAHWYYHPWFQELLQLFWLDISGTDPSDYSLYDKVIADFNAFLDEHPLPPTTLLTGEEVMELCGIEPGKKVGELLRALYGKQLIGDVKTKEEAREFVLGRRGGWRRGEERKEKRRRGED